MSGSLLKPASSGASVPPYHPLVIVLVAVCAGIVADRFWPLPVGAWWAMAAVGLGAWLGLWRWGRRRTASVALLAAAAAVAASWHHCQWRLFDADDVGFFAQGRAEPACVEAIALSAPRLVPQPEPDPMRTIPVGDRSRVELAATAIRDGDAWRAVSGRTRLEVDGPLTGVAAGDRIRIMAKLSRVHGARNPGEFDYADYLRADRVRCSLWAGSPDCVVVVERGSRWQPRQWIDAARTRGNERLRRWLAPRRAALASAVLLGVREELDPEQTQAFVETGTVHLLAISGLHVGIVAWALVFVLHRLPIGRGWVVFWVGGLTIFYMLLADARPPVVRATILVLVACGAIYLRRSSLSLNSLAAAGLVVLALNPAGLFHTGVQLSFLAVAALMGSTSWWKSAPESGDPLEALVAENRPWPIRALQHVGRRAWDLTLSGAVVWVVTAPLVMARFHLFTPVALGLNVVLWIPMGVALVSGFAALVLGVPMESLGWLPGMVCDKSLWGLQSVVEWARELPWGHAWVPGPPDWWLIGFYGGLGLLAAVPRIRPKRRWCLVLLAGWIAVGLAPRWIPARAKGLECTFLSVGHGCAVVLELPSGETVLYDAGAWGSPVTAARSISGFLWSRGIDRLDVVVISHADADHYNALPRLLEQFSVGEIRVSPAMWEDSGRLLDALHDSIRESGVTLREVSAGERIVEGDDCTLEVLFPPEREIDGDDNARSVVLDVCYRGHRILLPGDLESPGLDELLALPPRDCDVLLMPHHGSRQSDPPGLSAWCEPQWVVISGSDRYDTDPIEDVYRAAGSRVFHTADTGAVRVRIDANGIEVEPFIE